MFRQILSKRLPTPLSSPNGFHMTPSLISDHLDLSFNDHEAAFRSKKTSEIVRGYAVLTLCGFRPLVTHNARLMKLGQRILGKTLFGHLMKQSFYGQFVAGEDQEELKPVISRMHSFGVKSILDYSVEGDDEASELKTYSSYIPFDYHISIDVDEQDETDITIFEEEAKCDANLQEFLQCINAVKESTEGLGFAAIKITALCRPDILIKLSECIERTRIHYAQDHVKKSMAIKGGDNQDSIHLLDWGSLVDPKKGLGETFQVPNLETGKMEKLVTGDDDGALTAMEEEQFKNLVNRLHTLFKYAKERNVRVQVDAEQSYFQPAIHRLTVEMMRVYNTENAVVFSTHQCYLKKALEIVTTDLEQAKHQNFFYGTKLVRGAYMEQERARSLLLGYSDPINPNFEATSAMYHSVLDECLKRIKAFKDAGEDPDKIKVMVASHNDDTIRYGIRRMAELGLDPQDRVLSFAQLYGMCDQVTFPLGQAGYSVYKYVPYGPVHEVLPYLSRRATENGTMLTRVKQEKRLLLKELLRRVSKRELSYRPEGHYKPVGFD